MVASRQVEIPLHRGVGRQHGRRFGAFPHVIGKTANPFLRQQIVPAAIRVGAVLLEFAVPESTEFLVVEKLSRQLQRVWEDGL